MPSGFVNETKDVTNRHTKWYKNYSPTNKVRRFMQHLKVTFRFSIIEHQFFIHKMFVFWVLNGNNTMFYNPKLKYDNMIHSPTHTQSIRKHFSDHRTIWLIILDFYLSWVIFTCHIIEYRANFYKSCLSFSTSRRQVLPDIDLRQTRFRIDCTLRNQQKYNNIYTFWTGLQKYKPLNQFLAVEPFVCPLPKIRRSFNEESNNIQRYQALSL